MKQRKAILYIRVSTDEQAEKGHSLAHQEDKLRQYCLYNNLDVVAFYKEDHSAKTFERPQFRQLLEFVRKNKGAADTLLFLKWDRFSRNAPEAYGMIGTLSKLGIEPQAAEQPLNLDVPEQKIMLAIYLTAPEVENDRRAMNVHAGMRRAKKEGRYMGSAPYGYKHARTERNRPCIAPGPGAELIREAFEKMATGLYHIEELRKLMYGKGLKLTKNAFWVLLRSPVYMGKIYIPAYKDEPASLVDGTHEALISADLFYLVQEVLEGRRAKNRPVNNTIKEELQLRGYIKCGRCGRNLTGSGSLGHGGRYYYYHCKEGCKERFRAEAAHQHFYSLLRGISGNRKTLRLFERTLGDSRKKDGTERTTELQKLAKEIEVCQARLTKAQTKFLDDELSAADYNAIKARIEPEMAKLMQKQSELNLPGKGELDMIDFGISYLTNLPKLFTDADLRLKHRMLGSTFPGKLVFENGKCRTSDSDEIITLIAAPSAGSTKKQDGDNSENCSPSCRVEDTGLLSNTFIDFLSFIRTIRVA